MPVIKENSIQFIVKRSFFLLYEWLCVKNYDSTVGFSFTFLMNANIYDESSHAMPCAGTHRFFFFLAAEKYHEAACEISPFDRNLSFSKKIVNIHGIYTARGENKCQ